MASIPKRSRLYVDPNEAGAREESWKGFQKWAHTFQTSTGTAFFSDFQTNPAENLVEKDNERHLSFRSGAGTEPENGGLTWQWWAGHAFRLDQSFLLRESIWVAGIRIWENLVCLVCLKGLNEIVSERKLNQECLLDTGLICILCFSPRKKWNTIWTPAWTSWEKRFAEFCILNRRSRLSPAAAAWVFIY